VEYINIREDHHYYFFTFYFWENVCAFAQDDVQCSISPILLLPLNHMILTVNKLVISITHLFENYVLEIVLYVILVEVFLDAPCVQFINTLQRTPHRHYWIHEFSIQVIILVPLNCNRLSFYIFLHSIQEVFVVN